METDHTLPGKAGLAAEPPATIDQQIREVEAVYLSREAQVRQRRIAIDAGRSVPPDTGCITSSLPTLEAALRTLCWVRDHRDELRGGRGCGSLR